MSKVTKNKTIECSPVEEEFTKSAENIFEPIIEFKELDNFNSGTHFLSEDSKVLSSTEKEGFKMDTLECCENSCSKTVKPTVVRITSNHRNLQSNTNLFKPSQFDFPLENIYKSSRKKIFKCTICAVSFTSKNSLKLHSVKHSDKDNSKICKKRRKKKISIQTDELYDCGMCSKSFTRKSQLTLHTMIHTGEKPFPCYICGRAFNNKGSRRKHYKTHTGEKPYSCEICQKSFGQLHSLQEHQVTHTKEKVHTCEICNKKFTTKSSMKRHLLTHTNACDECGETFRNSSTLDKHKGLHDLNRPFSCPDCKKRFVTKTDLTNHVIVHSDVKAVSCNVCQNRFKTLKRLYVHHRQCHREIPWLNVR